MKKAVHYTANYIINPVHPVKITLIGAGGTGSFVLTNLARLHAALTALGHPGFYVTCFDGDTVSETNIGRQLFSPSDIGAYKSDILITRINRYFGLTWESNPIMFDEDQLDESQRAPLSNIYITAVDTAKARINFSAILGTIYENCFKGDYENDVYYWLDIGNTKNTGQVILGNPLYQIPQPKSSYATIGNLPTILDLYPNLEDMDTEEDQGPSCSFAEAISKQDLFINSTLAQYATHLLWKMIKDLKIENHGVFINLETMKANPLPIKREEN
jgi:PRTRC genetic system ThiF family protein